VNLAVDRGAIAELFEGRGFPTCQILPAGFPGYVPYCPYSRHPGGTWTGPDLRKAQELVDRSGTAGSRVIVWGSLDAFPVFPVVPVSRHFVNILNDLGYHAVLKVVPAEQYFARVFNASRGVQVASAGWATDYPAESGYLPPLVTCGSVLNISRFCDRGIERQMEEATNLQLVDPLAAHDLWSSTEHHIVDLAPIVPLVSRSWAAFASERLGNYQFNPQWGPLIDQMWVR
jgi:peptide/nickel transport system substrate-binding protein